MRSAARALVAVIDDEPSVRQAFGRLLRAAHFSVQLFASGAEFLSSLESCRPACLILDLEMSGMNGLEVMEQLASRERWLPVIVITAHDDPAMRAQCLAGGAIAQLSKPVRSEALLCAVSRALERGPP